MTPPRIHVYELGERLDLRLPGETYRAVVADPSGPLDPTTLVMLRVVDVALLGDEATLDRLRRDLDRAGQIDLPGVMAPLDCGIEGTGDRRRVWWVCAHVPGRSLDSLLTHVGPLPDALAESLAIQCARAIAAVHSAGLESIGLSPASVLLRDDSALLLMDPGAGAVHRASWPAEGEPTWPMLCASPEMALGRDEGRSEDLYALGAMLYRCITGRWHRPHRDVESFLRSAPVTGARRPTEVKPTASQFLSEVTCALIDLDPLKRFDSAQELVRVLEQRRKSDWWATRDVEDETRVEEADTGEQRHDEPLPLEIPEPAPAPATSWIASRMRRDRRIAVHRSRPVGLAGSLGVLMKAVRTLDRGGETILIRGPEGVGKTRLVDAFLDALEALPEQDAPLVLVGEHRHLGIGRPLQAFSEAVTALLSEGREVDAVDVAPLLGDAAGIADGFAAFLSGASAPDDRHALARESLATAFSRVLETLSACRPVVFVVENLQWADPEGLDLFGYLTRVVANLRVLLIATLRPAGTHTLLGSMLPMLGTLPHVSVRDVEPLDAAGATELARAFVEPPERAAALATRIHATLGGNPRLLENTLHLLRAEGMLEDGGGERYLAGETADQADIPPSPDELLRRRFASLSPTATDVLAMAAVQGPSFDVEVVRLALEMEPPVLRDALAELERTAFLKGDGPARVFVSHPLYRHAFDSLSDVRLADFNAATAKAFLASRNPHGRPAAEIHGILAYRVAWHFLLAKRGEDGLLYVPAALRHLRETWRIGDAERLATSALSAMRDDPTREGEVTDLMLTRAEFLGLQGRREEQRDVLTDALLRARAGGDQVREARVLLGSARLNFITNRLREARIEARDCLTLAQKVREKRLESRAHFLLGRVAFEEGRYQDARQRMHSVLDLARQLYDAAQEAEALHALGSISQGVGSFEHAEELQRAAMKIYRREGDLAHEAETLTSLGNIAAASGDFEKAEACLKRALATFRSLADGYGEARALGHLGMVLQDSGRFREAREAHRQCLDVSREMGAGSHEIVALLNLATTNYVLGYLDEARDYYGDALRTAREIEDLRLIGYALTGLGDTARQRSEWVVARGLFSRAVAHFRDVGDQPGLAAALLASGRAELMSGEPAAALELLTEAAELASARHARVVTALAQGHLALLRAREGAAEEAHSRMAQAGALIHDISGADLARVELHFLQGLVFRVLGHRVEADRTLLRARTTLEAAIEDLPPDDRLSLTTHLTPFREILAGSEPAAARLAAETAGSDTAEV